MARNVIRIERRGHVTLFTIERPAVANALDRAAQAELAQAFDAFQADDGQWIAILTGAGRHFCAGYDLGSDPQGKAGLPATGFGGLTARFDLHKPVIAAINGPAVGGGFELALACDIIVAAPEARFALPEAKVGVTALGGGILRLTRAIGHHAAMSIVLTGRAVGAEEGRRMGFVTEIAEDGDVVAAALRWADDILACSPLAVRGSKAVACTFADADLGEAMDRQWELPAIRALLGSDDAREGPAAFRERRPPRWTGA